MTAPNSIHLVTPAIAGNVFRDEECGTHDEEPLVMNKEQEQENKRVRARLRELLPIVLAQLPSPHSQRCYKNYLTRFLDSKCAFTRDGIIEHLTSRRLKPMSGSVKRMTVSALRRLLKEADIHGLVSEKELRLINGIRCTESTRRKAGTWLTLESARELIALPNRRTTDGKRDAAIMALLLGCGLRREEAVNITWQQYQLRDARAVLVDVEGKGRKLRTVPVPAWAQRDVDAWKAETERLTGATSADLMRLYALRRVVRRVKVSEGLTWDGQALQRTTAFTLGDKLSPEGVWYVVNRAAMKLGIKIKPHDLRRTLAKLMRKRGVALEQIQFQLGHASVKTTEIYLGGGIELEVGIAGVDQTGMGD